MRNLNIIFLLVLILPLAAWGQVNKNVQKVTGTNAITEDLVIPSARTLTIESANNWADNVRQIFNPGATVAGINFGSVTADPSTPINGDYWYNSTAGAFKYRANGVTVTQSPGVAAGAVTSSGLTMATARLLGRNTASTGAIEEITLGTNLSFTGTTLNASGGGGSGDMVGPASSTASRLMLFDGTTGKLAKQSTAITEAAGVFTSNTLISLVAGGTNQDINITPSGTGNAIISGGIRTGTASASSLGTTYSIYGATDPTGSFGMRRASADISGAFFLFSKARGSIGSPAALTNGDIFGEFYGGGYDGSNWSDYQTTIRFIASQNWTSSNRGTEIVFATTPNSTTTRTNWVYVRNSGVLEASGGLSISGGNITADKTVTAGGVTGAATINKNAGTVNFAASATSLVVTNSRVTTGSIIVATVGTMDTTMKSVRVVAASGSFTIYPDAAPAAETRVNWFIVN